MLSRNHPLFFPKLVHLPTGKESLDARMKIQKANPDMRVHAPLYSLDWSVQEEAIKHKHEHSKRNIPFIPGLPEEYDKWMKSLRFVVSHDYRQEIHHMAQLCLDEWDRKRLFDTVIREACLSVGIEAAWRAFYLLEDCTFDEGTQYFARDPKSKLAAHVMAYKFWSHQTGRGMVFYHAKIDELKKRIEQPGRYSSFPEDHEAETEALLGAIEKHERRVREAHQELCVDSGPAKDKK